MNVLALAVGNPSRGDDALGPLLLERLEAQRFEGLDCLTDFQLQIEHALDLEGRDLVLFIDAHVSVSPPFGFSRIMPESDKSYTTHAMSPAAVLQVYRQVKGEPPPSFLLAIRGEQFELGLDLSQAALIHLEAAEKFAEKLCQNPSMKVWLDYTSKSEMDSPL